MSNQGEIGDQSRLVESAEVEQEPLVRQLHEGWKLLDQVFTEEHPHLSMFREKLNHHYAERKRRMWKELSIFWIVALFMLMIATVLYNNSVYYFIAIQLLSIIIAPIIVFIWLWKRKRGIQQ